MTLVEVITGDERSLRAVPWPVLLLLLAGLALQIMWHHQQPPPEARADALPTPPSTQQMRIASLGDPIATAKLGMLWLQVFDNQPGISIPFKALDYTRVEGWLARFLQLDPGGQYPLLAASRLYGVVPDPVKKRQMLDLVYREFFTDPNQRWPWLAHAAIVAKYQLHDLPLALKFAQAIAAKSTGTQVPHWAQQMQIFILEDLGEVQSAKILIGGLLDSGRITEPHELHFLHERLTQLEHEKTTRHAAP